MAWLLAALYLLPVGASDCGAGGTGLSGRGVGGDAARQVFLAQPSSSSPVSPPSEGGLLDPREGGLEVGLGEWAVTLEADAIRPGPVTFVIRNRGTRAHGFRIRSRSGRGRDRFEARSPLIQPGGERRLTADLAPGTYRVECYVTDAAGNHAALGMRTVLRVSADAPLLRKKPSEASSGVSIAGFSFTPAALKVPVGTTVTWTNKDPTPHTVTADDGSFDSGAVKPGGTFGRTFDRTGTFSYHCGFHPSMQGRVEVGQ